VLSRREILQSLSNLPLVRGAILGGSITASSAVAEMPFARDYFKELGVRTLVNALGPGTHLTASLMPEEVLDAYRYAARDFVNLDELHDRVGERIAGLLHCESATVTAGCSAAITLGTAGILAGLDEQKIAQIPDLTGMKSEIISQKSHRSPFDHATHICGARIIEVETRDELERAINENTAMFWFLNKRNDDGEIRHEEFVELAQKHEIPTLIDCASDLPPKENLWKFTKMGFDLVCFSGGKGMCGPQSTGLLLGKEKYIRAARMHTPPRAYGVGRGMKVNKEEVLGMLVALELYLSRDHDLDWKVWENQIRLIHDRVVPVPGVRADIEVPNAANNKVPTLRLAWDQEQKGLSYIEFVDHLRNGHPSIETWKKDGKDGVYITTWMMRPGQERVVAERVKQVLESAP